MKHPKHKYIFLSLLIGFMFILMSPTVALAADIDFDFQELDVINNWGIDQTAGTANPPVIFVGEQSTAPFNVSVSYHLTVSGFVYITAPETMTISSWDVYLEKYDDSTDGWNQVKTNNGIDNVKVNVIDQETTLNAGETIAFQVQPADFANINPIKTGESYQWKSVMQIKQQGETVPSDYSYAEDILHYHGP